MKKKQIWRGGGFSHRRGIWPEPLTEGPTCHAAATLAKCPRTQARCSMKVCAARVPIGVVTAAGEEESGRHGASLDACAGASEAPRRPGPKGGGSGTRGSPERNRRRHLRGGRSVSMVRRRNRKQGRGIGCQGEAPAHQQTRGVDEVDGEGPRRPELNRRSEGAEEETRLVTSIHVLPE
jgi:hypothetical protein